MYSRHGVLRQLGSIFIVLDPRFGIAKGAHQGLVSRKRALPLRFVLLLLLTLWLAMLAILRLRSSLRRCF